MCFSRILPFGHLPLSNPKTLPSFFYIGRLVDSQTDVLKQIEVDVDDTEALTGEAVDELTQASASQEAYEAKRNILGSFFFWIIVIIVVLGIGGVVVYFVVLKPPDSSADSMLEMRGGSFGGAWGGRGQQGRGTTRGAEMK